MVTHDSTSTGTASQMAPDEMRGLAARLRARADSILMRDCSHQQADLRAAAGLIEHLADLNAEILSSDYVPASLMESIFRLPQSGTGITLPQAVRFASFNPARAVGLDDRGEIAPEKRADLVRVRVVEDAPIVRSVWREGERVV